MNTLWVQWLRWLRAILLAWLEITAWWRKARDGKSSPGARITATLLMGIGLILLWLSLREPPMPIPPGVDQVVIDLNERTTTPQEIAELERRLGIDLDYNSPEARDELLMVAEVPPGRMKAVLGALHREPDVEAAEPNYVYRLPEPYASTRALPRANAPEASWKPNDPLYDKQWNLRLIGMEEAWKTTQGKDVVVAVIDTGVSYEDYKEFQRASDLKQTQFARGFNFIANNTHANDDHGHGTHVTGTVAQSTNNGHGVAGIAFRSRIMPIKALNRYGMGTLSDIADAIRFAADNGAQVINMSLGGPMNSRILEEACRYAYRKGVTIVCAAGNESSERVSYPARFKECVAIGSVGPDKKRAFYSNYGEGLALVAPGGNKNLGEEAGILQNAVLPGEGDAFYWFQGTSMASPHAAGVAALVHSLGVHDPERVRTILLETATSAGPSKEYGAGLLNAAAAVKRAQADGAGNVRLAGRIHIPRVHEWPWVDWMPLALALFLPYLLVAPGERKPRLYLGILLGFGLLLIWRHAGTAWDTFTLWRWLRDVLLGGVGALAAFGLFWGVRRWRPVLLGLTCFMVSYWLLERFILWGTPATLLWWGVNMLVLLSLLRLARKNPDTTTS